MFQRNNLNFLRHTTIYEVNLRQYTQEGSIRAFMEHLPRLKKMGIGIIWLMPIHPIGLKNRKGTLGSYYSISDYQQINPEFGTLTDFKALVELVHQLDMKIIIDWVANHSAWDNEWTMEHPDYFVRDESGAFQSPYDWSDVIQFDHSNPAAHQALIDAMCFWVREYDIDGFRADLAHLTPLPYWIKARMETEKIKPELTWLAETEDAAYFEAFDVVYAWKWMHGSEEFVKKNEEVFQLIEVLKNQNEHYPENLFQLFFTSNHDENSWNGTEFEKYGIYADALTAFSFFYKTSVPLVYSGQEIPNTKRLAFFEKDALVWDELKNVTWYKTLAETRSKVCHSPEFDFIETKGKLFGLKRGDNQNHILLFMNFDVNPIQIHYEANQPVDYFDAFNNSLVFHHGKIEETLQPGQFLLVANK